MRIFTLLLLVSLLTFANAGNSFTATIGDGVGFVKNLNVTIDEGDIRFHYRKTRLLAVPVVNNVFYTSTAVSAEYSGSSVEGDVDAIFAYAAAPSNLVDFHPGVLMAYIAASGEIDTDELGATFSLSGASIATLYKSLEERTSSGSVVKVIDFDTINFSVEKHESEKNPEIQYVTFTGSKSGATITISLVVSSVTGILNVGGAAMTPKSVEIIVEIEYDSYMSAGNYLSLDVITATVSAIAEVGSSSNTMVSGSGPTQVYMHFNGEAVVDGEVQPVIVTGVEAIESSSATEFGIFRTHLTANAELHVDCRRVSVAFPSGAGFVSYDPTMGFEAPSVYAGAGALTVPVALIFAFSALLMMTFGF